MSTDIKENWDDDSSDDEEGCLRSACPDPPQKSDKQSSPSAPYVNTNKIEDNMIYDEVEFTADEGDVEASAEEYPPEEEYYSENEDDYEDELDAYDKKLGRFVSCR
jgi:hypothetical protein